MVGDLKVGYKRLAESLYLDILGIIFTDRYGRIDDIGDDSHDLVDLLGKLSLLSRKCLELFSHIGYLLLGSLGFFLLALSHEGTDLLAYLVTLRP